MSDVMPYPSRRFKDLTPEELKRYHRSFEDRIQSAVDRFRPDILHSHHLWLMTALIRRLVLALSRIQREEILALHGLPPERVWVTGTGFRGDLFKMPDHKPLAPPVELIYAGKLCRAKGLPNLLRALATVQDLPWHLTLAGGGSGPEKEECLQLIHPLGSRVTVIGSVPQPALALAMQKAHVFILSSFFEGLPLVLLEAMACGCRVIATEVPGVRELFETNFSPWIQTLPTPPLRQVDKPLPGTEGAFEDHLAVLLRSQIQAVLDTPAIPAQEIRRFLEPFTWPRVFERIERVYQNLAGGAPLPLGRAKSIRQLRHHAPPLFFKKPRAKGILAGDIGTMAGPGMNDRLFHQGNSGHLQQNGRNENRVDPGSTPR